MRWTIQHILYSLQQRSCQQCGRWRCAHSKCCFQWIFLGSQPPPIGAFQARHACAAGANCTIQPAACTARRHLRPVQAHTGGCTGLDPRQRVPMPGTRTASRASIRVCTRWLGAVRQGLGRKTRTKRQSRRRRPPRNHPSPSGRLDARSYRFRAQPAGSDDRSLDAPAAA